MIKSRIARFNIRRLLEVRKLFVLVKIGSVVISGKQSAKTLPTAVTRWCLSSLHLRGKNENNKSVSDQSGGGKEDVEQGERCVRTDRWCGEP